MIKLKYIDTYMIDRSAELLKIKFPAGSPRLDSPYHIHNLKYIRYINTDMDNL